jgi:ubiquinone/menaquinone biosynthesis C-methylase UbiE
MRALVPIAAICLVACAPILVEREGHQVFNPAYLPYLETPSRDAWQQPDAVVRALALPPDAVVADVGAGGGYFTERLAQELPAGHVYATDVQDEMLEALHARVHASRLANVTVVRGSYDAPGLPAACCDLVFFSSVYKEIDARAAYLREVRRLLRPDGRVAILEFRPWAWGIGPPRRVRLAPEQIVAELDAAGFELLESHDVVPRQSFLVFRLRQHAL